MDPERERAEQGLVAVLNKALRQVPFVRLDCVDDVTALFADCLSYMESHLELGDSDDEGSGDDDEQQRQQQLQQPMAEHKLSSRATSADRRTRDEQSSAAAAAPLVTSLPAAPGVDSRGRLGLGGVEREREKEKEKEKVPVLPPAGLATKLIGSAVTRDYSSPSQSKRSLGGGVGGGKRGSITLPSAVNLAAAAGGSTSVSPTSASGVSPTSSSSGAAAASGTPTLPPPASLTASTSSSGSGSIAGSSSSSSSGSSPAGGGKLGLGLGLKGPGGLMSSNAAAQTHVSSASASSANSAPAALHSAPSSSSSSSLTTQQPAGSGAAGSAGSAAGAAAAGPAAGVGGGGGKQIGLGHRPSSRAQYNAAASAVAASSTDDEEQKESASAGSGPSSGQSSDTDEEVIRVARPLGGAPKNKLLHRAAAGLASREYPSPKLGPRSLGASPAGMGPRGMSAPNNNQQQQQGQAAAAGQQQQQHAQSSHSQRAPVLSHAASTGSAPSISSGGLLATDSFLTQPPSLSSPPSLAPSTSEPSDVDVLPEPSASLRDDGDAGGGQQQQQQLGEPPALAAAAAGGLVLTEAAGFVKEKQLSDKEALDIPEGAESEEKDLVDEALEKRPDPLQKLRNEVIVPVTASPKQYRSSLKLLTLAAESAQSADGAITLPDSDPLAAANGTQLPAPSSLAASNANELSSHRLNPLLSAASLPSGSLASPSHSASNTPKPAFLRRLDSPESHHGQLIAAKAKLSMLINRALQTIPNIKKDALPAVQHKLEHALAKLEASTIQP